MKTQVNGITIAYDDRGTGFPIVFLHAFPFNRTMWRQQETALCQGYRTISIDLRGHGESDAPFWRYSLEQYARDVKEVLAGLGIAGAVFVGLSMGGYGAWYLITRYPDKFAAAIPICGGGDWNQVDNFKHVHIWSFNVGRDEYV